jgi:hypothetical protein
MIERVFNTIRGLLDKSKSDDRSNSATNAGELSTDRGTAPSDPGDQVVLGDLADSDTYDKANADVGRQGEPPGATGASTDEFEDAGFAGDPVDQDDVEDAAEPGLESTPSRSDLDDTSGDDDSNSGDIPVGSGDLDEADNIHDAVGRNSTDDDTSELDEGLVDRSGVVDRSMEGDTDYVVSGYPSESIDDIDIQDTDDIGVYDADSVGDIDNDDADFSDDTGNLGLADSETIDEESPATTSGSIADASGFSPVSSNDVGVGVAAEVDDTSLIANSDDGADSSLQGTTDDEGAGEGVQSFGSTADRDVLADMQDTAANQPDSGSSPPLGRLGSDPSAVDDKPPLGIPPAAEEEQATISSSTSGADDDGDFAESPVAGQSDASAAGVTGGNTSGRSSMAGAIRGDGGNTCPADFPIKGNANSKIYHTPGRASYDGTIPEWCFATEEDAVNAGYRAPKR